MRGMEKVIFLMVVLAVFAVPSLADISVSFVSPTPSNATWRNGTQGLSSIIINVTANSSIIANDSSFVQWYNNSNASANHSATIGSTANLSGTNRVNYTYWMFNMSGYGIYRFDVILLVNSTLATTVNETSAVVQRYVYYLNSTPNLTLNDPSDNQRYEVGAGNSVNVSINYVGRDITSTDTCYYTLDNGSVNILAGCGNSTVSLSDIRRYSLNVTINNSAGVQNSTYITFRVETQTSGGGAAGGGGSAPVVLPGITEPKPLTPSPELPGPLQPESAAGTALIPNPVAVFIQNIFNGIADFVSGILRFFTGGGAQAGAVMQPQGGNYQGLFGIYK